MQIFKVSNQILRSVLLSSAFYQLSFLITLTIIVYWPTFNNQFQVFWDDQWVVMNSYTEDGLNWDNIKRILTEFYHGQYAPLNQLTYTFLYSIFGYNAFWFHSISLLIHLFNVIVVYHILKSILKKQSLDFQSESIHRIAIITTGLFAIHPFNVEAVAWVSASKIIFYSFFYLLAIWFYLKYLKNENLLFHFTVVVFFVLSFAAKEQAVTLPICLLLIDYVYKRDFKNLKIWLEKLPLFLLAIFFGIVTLFSQAAVGDGVFSIKEKYPFYQNIIFASYSFSEYMVKCLVPIKLSFFYPFPNQIGDYVPLTFWLYPFLIIFIMLTLWSFWKKKWVFFGTSFFLIHISLTIHIIPISRFTIVADRYVYLSSIGIFFIMAFFLDKAIRAFSSSKKLIITFFSFYILGLGTYTFFRTKVWYNTDTLKSELQHIIENKK